MLTQAIVHLNPCVLLVNRVLSTWHKQSSVLYLIFIVGIPQQVVTHHREQLSGGARCLDERNKCDKVLWSKKLVQHFSNVVKIFVTDLNENAALWRKQISGKLRSVAQISEV